MKEEPVSDSGRGLLGWLRGGSPGPLLLCVGGLHGNEPAGVRALEKVLGQLEPLRDRVSGDFVAVAGNLGALAAGRRFLSYDLNRAWTDARLAAARNRRPSINGKRKREDLEVQRLLSLLEQVAEGCRGPVYALDIHTTSSGGGAFTTTADYLANRRFAMAIPVPLVLGLEENVEGTLVGYLDHFGYTTAVFECGQHEEAEASERAVAAVWLAVRAAGLLPRGSLPEARRGFLKLKRACKRLPKVLEMRYRHPVEDEDKYLTRPGYLNFQHIQEGEVVGDDRGGPVSAPERGRMLMPLYQEQGEDGFFVVREFSRLWLWLSLGLRRLRIGLLAPLLPGVRKVPGSPGTLAANLRWARWGTRQLFRLLGFRRVSEDAKTLVVTRRRRGAAKEC